MVYYHYHQFPPPTPNAPWLGKREGRQLKYMYVCWVWYKEFVGLRSRARYSINISTCYRMRSRLFCILQAKCKKCKEGFIFHANCERWSEFPLGHNKPYPYGVIWVGHPWRDGVQWRQLIGWSCVACILSCASFLFCCHSYTSKDGGLITPSHKVFRNLSGYWLFAWGDLLSICFHVQYEAGLLQKKIK